MVVKIIVRGGVVQEVQTDEPNVIVQVWDYDSPVDVPKDDDYFTPFIAY